MLAKLRPRSAYDVMAALALFIALATGSAYAANTVFSSDIVNGEVKNDDLAVNAVGSNKIADRSVKNADLSIGASSSNTIADGGVQGIDVKNDTLTGAQIAESALDATPLRSRVAEGGCEGNGADDVMVKVGSVCIDRYENSIWDAPTGGNQITGTIPCNANGQDCTDIYARSVAGVTPRANITYFQAQQALANSGKRLPTNAEWQIAVAGTPDSTDCNVGPGGSVQNTGANASCISNHSANDMVGNLYERVADWDEEAAGCQNWGSGLGDDQTCMGRGEGDAVIRWAGALIRGGSFQSGSDAGPFAVFGFQLQDPSSVVGFRGAR